MRSKAPRPPLPDDGNVNTHSHIDTNDQYDSPSQSPITKQTSTLSGRIVDIDGKPVTDLPIYIRSVNTSGIGKANTTFLPHYLFTSQHSQTNNEGIFTIKKILLGLYTWVY